MKSLLNQAIELSPTNQVALLNKVLLLWQQGMVRDEQFQYVLQTKIYKSDPDLSRLFYIMFKTNIQGGQGLSGSECRQEMKEFLRGF